MVSNVIRYKAHMKIKHISNSAIYLVLFVVSSHSISQIDKAIPDRIYSNKTENVELYLATKEKFRAYASYDWSICNKSKFESTIKYYFMQTLEPRIKYYVVDAMKLTSIYINESNLFFTEATLEKVRIELAAILNPKGLCVENLKVYPYNKSFKSVDA